MYSVYILSDPRDQKVRYVGISDNPEKRYIQHLSLHESHPSKNAWVIDLRQHNLQPTLDVIESLLPLSDARNREKHWINHYYRVLGMPLFNRDGVNRVYAGRGMTGRPAKKPKYPTAQMELDIAFTPQEAAKKLGKPTAIVLHLFREKTIPGAYKVSGQWRIDRSDLEKYIEEQKNKQR